MVAADWGSRKRPSSSKRSIAPARTPAPVTRRCTSWERCCVTARRNRSSAIFRKSPRANCVCNRSPSPSRPPARTRRRSRPSPRERRSLRRQRPEGVHLARAAFGSHAAARAHHASGRGEEENRRPLRLPHRSARVRVAGQRGTGHHAAPDSYHGESRNQRSLLRQLRNPRGESDRRGGQRLPLHSRRHERRAYPDRRRMHRRRLLVYRPRAQVRAGPRRVRSTIWRKTKVCSFPSPEPIRTSARPT